MFPSMMRDFDDAFFAGPMESMRRMESMMDSMMSPFGGMFGPMGLQPPPQDNRQVARAGRNHNSLMPFGFGHSLFPNMDNMFSIANMGQDPNCHSFSSSSVMTYTRDESGQPQVYQATSSTRSAPGGVKETRETLQDSRSGLQKMAIGHHLNERSHVVEKKKYRYTGEEEENHEYVNLEDDDVEVFDKEWQQRAQAFQSRSGQGAITGRGHRQHAPEPQLLALTDGSSHAGRHGAEASSGAEASTHSHSGKKRTGYLKRKNKQGPSSHRSGRPHGRQE